MAQKIQNLVVGAGISGATIARLLAEAGQSVLVIDAKDHIGGNCFDYRDNGIMVHKYGTHIFHTTNKEVWDFCSRFTKWHPYQHKVRGLIDGQIVPIPFNLNSLHAVFPKTMSDRIEAQLIEHFGFNKKVPILKLREAGNQDLAFLADYIYEKVFLEYTLKQWGQSPDDIDPAITGRVPVYISHDDRYFQDKYQGIPLDGYTKMIKRMLTHPKIKVKTKTPYKSDMQADRIFFTGAIDEFFDYQLGELPYRSVVFDFRKVDKERFQDAAVINYPCNYDFTRIGEYKWFLDDKSPHTIISYEYPAPFKRGTNERIYPIVGDKNTEQYDRYIALAKAHDLSHVHFLGRLGDYKYYDMDKAIARALNLFKELENAN